jgi:multisubunit Na+/H+ antiporter MnhB subunit
MNAAALVLDGLLALSLPVFAWRVLAARDLYRAVILFITFGVVLALAWARLGAPDIALAEAAIGAGITGALLLNTVGGLSRKRKPGKADGEDSEEDEPEEPTDRVVRSKLTKLAAIPVLALSAALGWAVLALPEPVVDMPALVQAQIAEGDVSHGVTAVLLDYRSYDTFLEIGVLLLAALCVWSLGLSAVRGSAPEAVEGSPVLAGFVRLLGPAMVVSGVYLLWAGTSQPGGAFQAGAILGAFGVLMVLSGLLSPSLGRGGVVRAGLAVGFAVFLLVGALAGLATGAFLQYPVSLQYGLILAIECFLTFSIALTLTALFTTTPPATPPREVKEEQG